MPKRYIPERGDLVWLSFDPQAGHEQQGHRPALVLSPKLYNSRVGLAVFCPITSSVKGYPFEVNLPESLPVRGAILSDQVKSLDWHVRSAKFMGRLPVHQLEEVTAKIIALLDPA